MSFMMTAVLGSVVLLAGGLFLFWSYWAVRISVNETRKITRRLRRVPEEELRTQKPKQRELTTAHA